MTQILKNRSSGGNKIRLNICMSKNRARQVTEIDDRMCLTQLFNTYVRKIAELSKKVER